MPKPVRNNQSLYTEQSLLDHLAGNGLDVAVCWKLSLTSGVSVGATSCTHDLVLPGHPGMTFKSNGGASPSAVDAEAGQSSAGLEVEAVFDDDLITEAHVASGDLDDAVFEIFRVNYKVLDMGELVDFSGLIGEIHSEGPRFQAEARPKTSLAGLNIGRYTRSRCDVKHFADKFQENRCKLDPAGIAPDGGPLTVTGTVTTGGSVEEFIDSSRTETEDDYFEEVTFTSGVLSGRTYEVRRYDKTLKKFMLQVATAEEIAAGVTYSAKRRCWRTEADCIKFANIINNRSYGKITNIEDAQRINRA